jgi:hypothetical protein
MPQLVEQQQDAFALDELEGDAGGVGQAVVQIAGDEGSVGTLGRMPRSSLSRRRLTWCSRCFHVLLIASSQRRRGRRWRPSSRCRRGARAPDGRRAAAGGSACCGAGRARRCPWARAACGRRATACRSWCVFRSIGILPTACTASVWNMDAARCAISAISSTGKMVPVSLLAHIAETMATRSLSSERIRRDRAGPSCPRRAYARRSLLFPAGRRASGSPGARPRW